MVSQCISPPQGHTSRALSCGVAEALGLYCRPLCRAQSHGLSLGSSCAARGERAAPACAAFMAQMLGQVSQLQLLALKVEP